MTNTMRCLVGAVVMAFAPAALAHGGSEHHVHCQCEQHTGHHHAATTPAATTTHEHASGSHHAQRASGGSTANSASR